MNYKPAETTCIPISMIGRPVLELFRAGFDTWQISVAKGLREHTIYKQLSYARENERRINGQHFNFGGGR